MTDSLEKRRKRLAFRSRHRGTQELDLVIGSFAERYLQAFDELQMDHFEALLDVAEPVIYDWVTGKTAPPAEYSNDVTDLLLSFKFEPPAR